MSVFLLDVNVLVAMAWPAHGGHQRVTRWLTGHARKGWATCPITQAGFVRILSNPAFSADALTVRDAIAVLRQNLSHPAHRFWLDDIDLDNAIRPFHDQLTGHQQITDAYLLGLAIRKKGKLATLDRSIISLVGTGNRDAVELVSEET